jgi:cold shock protein
MICAWLPAPGVLTLMDRAVRDRYLTCASCRNRFLYSAEEQRQCGREDAPRRCPGCRALERLGQRRTGVVDWYNRRRGYGFIRQEDGESVFLHASAWPDEAPAKPAPGMRVSYLVQHADKGPRAVDIQVLTEDRAMSRPGEEDSET